MKILFAASEGVPFCKTGGLADVVGALSQALARKGHQVRVLLPLYKEINRKTHQLRPVNGPLFSPAGHQLHPFHVWEKKIDPRLTFWFIESARFFNRRGLYGYQAGPEYPDNDLRFIFFSRAALELTRDRGFRPDVVHCHDWQTGLVPAFLKSLYQYDPYFSSTTSVLSIHNMAYQGIYNGGSFYRTGLPLDEKFESGLTIRKKKDTSFLKAGLVFSDVVNTVSPTYKSEITTDPKIGLGLEKVLQKRQGGVHGIVNGLDVDYWNPGSDPHLACRYDEKSLEKRRACKQDLQKRAGLLVSEKTPLCGFVGRLETQKGVDILIRIVPSLLKKGVQFVFLGRGNAAFEKDLRRLHERYPKQVFSETAFAEPLAHRIYAGSDLFLMPSRFEPCGLGQMIAMRYGAIPVVNATGGLIDTVTDISKKDGTGLVCQQISATGFKTAINRGLALLKDEKRTRAIQIRGMRKDFSWDQSLKGYLSLYKHAKRRN